MALTKVTFPMTDRASQTDADNNTAFGEGALESVTVTNARGTAFGKDALKNNTTGLVCTAVGFEALKNNTSGLHNTAFGSDCLVENTSGNSNTAIGRKSMTYNTTGNFNSTCGYGTLFYNETGTNNFAGGLQGLYSNRSGNQNVAIGRNAAYTSNSDDCISIGYQSRLYQSISDDNIGIGTSALESRGLRTPAGSLVIGQTYTVVELGDTDWVAVGASQNDQGFTFVATGVGSGTGAAALNTSASVGNTAIGHEAMRFNTTGANNCSFGKNTLISNSSGSGNSAFGIGSLTSNSTGSDNVAVGISALNTANTGSNNTALGAVSLYNLSSGSGNIGIGGFTSGGSLAPVFNVTTEDNRIVMGTTSVTNAYIQVAWSVVSDARDKAEINPIPHGLDFVKQLNPVSYKFRIDRDAEETHGNKRYGFLAQDILALEGDDNVIVDNEKPEKLTMTTDAIVPILVKAIQELEARIAVLEA